MGLCLIESMAKWVWVEPKKGRRARSLSACQGVELLAPPDPPETGGGGEICELLFGTDEGVAPWIHLFVSFFDGFDCLCSCQ